MVDWIPDNLPVLCHQRELFSLWTSNVVFCNSSSSPLLAESQPEQLLISIEPHSRADFLEMIAYVVGLFLYDNLSLAFLNFVFSFLGLARAAVLCFDPFCATIFGWTSRQKTSAGIGVSSFLSHSSGIIVSSSLWLMSKMYVTKQYVLFIAFYREGLPQ